VLREAGIDDPGREARLLLAHALGRDPATLLDRQARVDKGIFDTVVARRASREPLALITGRTGFWTLDLEVSPATLIPRADSESLIEAALEAFPDRARVHRMLDLGTGTGCLLLAALSEFRHAWGVGIDLDPDAAALARRNAACNHLAPRATLLCGNWASAIASEPGFDLVLSNPPYIETGAMPGLMPEVRRHEPSRALDGGADGLAAYRAIAADLPRLLAPGGVAILELGQGQGRAVGEIAAGHRLAIRAMRPDLSGTERAIVLVAHDAAMPGGI
jgi:release factor glutamine methyltransferase